MADEQDKDKDTDKAKASSNNTDPSGEASQEPGSGGQEHYDLGIAGNIANKFINTPVTPMLLIAALLVGVMGLIFTPRRKTRRSRYR